MKKSYTFTWIGIVICLLGLSPVSYAQAIEITDSAPFFENFNEISSSEENFGLSGWTLKSGYATDLSGMFQRTGCDSARFPHFQQIRFRFDRYTHFTPTAFRVSAVVSATSS